MRAMSLSKVLAAWKQSNVNCKRLITYPKCWMNNNSVYRKPVFIFILWTSTFLTDNLTKNNSSL